ncbi:MAG: methyltransferase domain-containing protein, partial [Parachlamydia sp.]|nr:methyltransferase domain-containing protein [Parachlamydia sp.]
TPFQATYPENYLLAAGKSDELRLTILNEIHNTFSLDKLQLSKGLKVLTLGCGIGLLEKEMAIQVGPRGLVIGTDISAEQIAIANENKCEGLHFEKRGALEASQWPDTFDRIHCRFLLIPFPKNKIIKLTCQRFRFKRSFRS